VIGARPDPGTDAGPRCSRWARDRQVDPVGTAGSYRSFLLVEWPLPWPHDLAEVAALGTLRPALAAAGARLQGLVPRGDGGQRTVILYRAQGDGGFAGYRRRELRVSPREVVDAAAALLSEPAPAGGGEDPAPAPGEKRPAPSPGRDDPAPAPGEEGPPPTHDVLVCTHGTRDRCCGSLGTGLALPLIADPDALGPRVRVWRTSHTGGHRFAPTALVFPEGTAWAYADAGLLRRVVAREDVDGALPHYRGCAGMATPRLQALERAVLAHLGWELLDRPRAGEDGGGPIVRLQVHHPADVWEAEVTVGRRLPVPPCGAPIEAATKSENEWTVAGLRQVTPRPPSERMAI
jgi:hypothetical protein